MRDIRAINPALVAELFDGEREKFLIDLEAEINLSALDVFSLGRCLPFVCWLSSYFDSSICFTRLTMAGSISYKPFTIFSMPGPSIGSISSFAFSASARS